MPTDNNGRDYSWLIIITFTIFSGTIAGVLAKAVIESDMSLILKPIPILGILVFWCFLIKEFAVWLNRQV